MKRFLLGLGVLVGVASAVVISGGVGGPGKTEFPAAARNPVTHLRWNDDPQEFRFALVSDRTGSHRADVFSQAVEKLNLLQPEFVVSVGDLIEGSKKEETIAAEWKEFDGFVGKLQMPFFYVAGNHDVSVAETAKFWQAKLGRRHYHFVYRGVLFLMLNSDDPPGSFGNLGKEQIAYARQTLKDNAGVRWTLVFIHRPLWTIGNGEKNGWREVEQALQGRPYTVFAGHVHRYQKFVRAGMNYYQLATTGGGSLMRGVDQGEFDHLVWVTMKKDGPILANLLLDAVVPEDLKKIPTNEPGKVIDRKPTHPVAGKVFFEGVPVPGAQVTLVPAKAKGKGGPVGVVGPDGSFRISTYQAYDGAPAGEYRVTVVWREGSPGGPPPTGPNRLPPRYADPETSGLTATIGPGGTTLVLELKR
jgi:predicted phosphodiesterase